MAVPRSDVDRFTFDMARSQRELLRRLAAEQGVSAGECLRRILAAHFAQLAQQEERTP